MKLLKSHRSILGCLTATMALQCLAVPGAFGQIPASTANLSSRPTEETPEQVALGHQLLSRIWKIVTQVPMTDSGAIFALLGVKRTIASIRPDHVRVVPRVDNDLVGTGATSIEHSPYQGEAGIEQGSGTGVTGSSLTIRTDPQHACILLEQVLIQFGSTYEVFPPQIVLPSARGNSSLDSRQRPAYTHGTIGFRDPGFLAGDPGTVILVFGNQRCAQSININRGVPK